MGCRDKLVLALVVTFVPFSLRLGRALTERLNILTQPPG